MSAELQRFQREIVEVCEFYVDDNNEAKTNVIFRKNVDGTMTYNNPTKYIRQILGAQGIIIKDNLFVEQNQNDETFDSTIDNVKEEKKDDVVTTSVTEKVPEQTAFVNPAPVSSPQLNPVNPVSTNNNNVNLASPTYPNVNKTVINSNPTVSVTPGLNQQVNPNINRVQSTIPVNNSEFNFNDNVDNL